MEIIGSIEDGIKDLVKVWDSFYLYDLNIMDQRMDDLSYLPQNVHTFYAMKANPNKDVIKRALEHQNISGIEVASKGEIKIVQEVQGSKDLRNLIYTGPSKTNLELEISVQNDIKYLNVESILEARRINALAKKRGIIQKILIRLNTKHKFEEGQAGVTLASGDTQFGLSQSKIFDDFSKLEELENIAIDGFHMYPATGVLNCEALVGSVRSTFQFVKEAENKLNRRFSCLDFGGGFGVDYGGEKLFDVKGYSQGLNSLIEEFSMQDVSLLLELGRYLTADMGYFCTKVNDIKTLESGTKAVLCYAGTNAHKRPQVLDVDYHVDVVKLNIPSEFKGVEKVNPKNTFNLYGPFCTSVDRLAKEKSGLDIEVGDVIVMPQAGAYGKTMSPQEFLSHDDVKEFIISK